MTTPDTPEPTCATCGHDDGHAPMKVGGIVVQHDTYCWLCNNEHPLKPTEALAEAGQSTRIIPARSDQPPTEALAPAAPSASQPEEAVPGASLLGPLDRARFDVFEAFNEFHNDDNLNGDLAVLAEAPSAALDTLEAAVRAEPPREEGGAAGEMLEAALSEYNDSVQHYGGCGYSFDARTPCSCGKARIADALVAAARAPGPAGEALEAALVEASNHMEAYGRGVELPGFWEAIPRYRAIAAARAPGPVAPFAFPEALAASPEEQRETDEFLDTAMGGEA